MLFAGGVFGEVTTLKCKLISYWDNVAMKDLEIPDEKFISIIINADTKSLNSSDHPSVSFREEGTAITWRSMGPIDSLIIFFYSHIKQSINKV